MVHKELNSKADFDAALATQGKYVLVYAYSGEVSPQAEAAADKHKDNTEAYKVDIEKYPTAKEYFKVTKAPTVVVFKDGKEIAKEEGMDQEKAKKIEAVLV